MLEPRRVAHAGEILDQLDGLISELPTTRFCSDDRLQEPRPAKLNYWDMERRKK
jgi:hypothetical protein